MENKYKTTSEIVQELKKINENLSKISISLDMLARSKNERKAYNNKTYPVIQLIDVSFMTH